MERVIKVFFTGFYHKHSSSTNATQIRSAVKRNTTKDKLYFHHTLLNTTGWLMVVGVLADMWLWICKEKKNKKPNPLKLVEKDVTAILSGSLPVVICIYLLSVVLMFFIDRLRPLWKSWHFCWPWQMHCLQWRISFQVSKGDEGYFHSLPFKSTLEHYVHLIWRLPGVHPFHLTT